MLIRFYNVPFQMDGEEVMAFRPAINAPAPTADTIEAALQRYLKGSVLSGDHQFAAFQDRIVITVLQDRETAMSNYCIVKDNRTGRTDDLMFFWITRWDHIIPEDAWIAYIQPDFLTLGLFSPLNAKPRIDGFITQVTGAQRTEELKCMRSVSYPTDGMEQTIRLAMDVFEEDSIAEGYTVLCMTFDDGDFAQYWIQEEFYVNYIGAISQIERSSDATKKNVKITKAYFIPKTITGKDRPALLTSGWTVAVQNGDTTKKIPLYFATFRSSADKFWSTNDVKIDFGAWAKSVGMDINPAWKAYLMTPSSMIELKDPTYARRAYFRLSVAGRQGYDGNDIIVQLMIDGVMYDISNEFLIDFAVNEQALWQSQHSELVAMQKVSAVIGGLGGAIGGVMSQNYFGAVQSVAGVASTFANIEAQKAAPAKFEGSGSFFEAMGKETSWLRVMAFEPSGNDAIKAYIAKYGYSLSAPAFSSMTSFLPDTAQGDDAKEGLYIRMSNVVVKNLLRGTNEAAQYIKGRLEAGIRFVDVEALNS